MTFTQWMCGHCVAAKVENPILVPRSLEGWSDLRAHTVREHPKEKSIKRVPA